MTTGMSVRPHGAATRFVVLVLLVMVESSLSLARVDDERTAWTNDPPSTLRAASFREDGKGDPVARKDSQLLKAISQQGNVFATKQSQGDQHHDIRDKEHVLNARLRAKEIQDSLDTNRQGLKGDSKNFKSEKVIDTVPQSDAEQRHIDVNKNYKLISTPAPSSDENSKSNQILRFQGNGGSLKHAELGLGAKAIGKIKVVDSPGRGDGESANIRNHEALDTVSEPRIDDELFTILRNVPDVTVIELEVGAPQKRMRTFLEGIIGVNRHTGEDGKMITDDENVQRDAKKRNIDYLKNSIEFFQENEEKLKFTERDDSLIRKLANIVRNHFSEKEVKASPDEAKASGIKDGASLSSAVRSKREEGHHLDSGEVHGESTAFPRPGNQQGHGQGQGPGKPTDDSVRIGYVIFTNNNKKIKESKEMSLADLHAKNATRNLKKLNRKYPVNCNHALDAHVPDYAHHQDRTPKSNLGLLGDDLQPLGHEQNHGAQMGHGASSRVGHSMPSGDSQRFDTKKEPATKDSGVEQSIIEILTLKAKVEDNAKPAAKKDEILEFYQTQGQQSTSELRRHHHAASVSVTHILLIMAVCVFTFITVMYLSSRFRSDPESAKRVNSQTALFEPQTKYDKY